MTLWRTIKVGTMVLMLIMGVACQDWAGDVKQDVAESTLIEVQKRGVLKVGMSTFVPWAMKDKTGKFIGFEIDVARQLAADMNVDVEFVPTQWKGILAALQAGKFDVLIGGMGITPDRHLTVNFTVPYEFSGMSIVASKQLAPGRDSLEAFNNPETVIAVRLGTTAEKAAIAALPNATLKQFSDEGQVVQELLNGRAHAMVASAPLPEQTAAKNPESLYLPLDSTFTKEPIGFAVRKGDHDFLTFLNSWITIKWHEGFLQERHDYWFRTMDWEDMVEQQ